MNGTANNGQNELDAAIGAAEDYIAEVLRCGSARAGIMWRMADAVRRIKRAAKAEREARNERKP